MEKKPQVLLIEDNSQNAYLTRFLLEQGGMEVEHRTNGAEGLVSARARAFDIILLDIQLPELDGYQVLKQLRSDPALATLPIVALSSYAMPADKHRALGLGFTAYIEKPIAPLKFAGQIRSYLKE
jgi:two-component system, cell cycle response regulator DivK